MGRVGVPKRFSIRLAPSSQNTGWSATAVPGSTMMSGASTTRQIFQTPSSFMKSAPILPQTQWALAVPSPFGSVRWPMEYQRPWAVLPSPAISTKAVDRGAAIMEPKPRFSGIFFTLGSFFAMASS